MRANSFSQFMAKMGADGRARTTNQEKKLKVKGCSPCALPWLIWQEPDSSPQNPVSPPRRERLCYPRFKNKQPGRRAVATDQNNQKLSSKKLERKNNS
jgi:hypothetical protein